jgi:hypothetical protein
VTDVTDRAAEQALFAARAFVARLERETGVEMQSVVRDRVLFAYEMGYLRGHGDGMHASMEIHDELRRKGNDADHE